MTIRRRALFSSTSPNSLTAEREYAMRWYRDAPLVSIQPWQLARAYHPAAGVSGEVPPPGLTGDGESL